VTICIKVFPSRSWSAHGRACVDQALELAGTVYEKSCSIVRMSGMRYPTASPDVFPRIIVDHPCAARTCPWMWRDPCSAILDQGIEVCICC
jgi:hypothetical protein